MPQGIVRNDGRLIQAQVLTSVFGAPALRGGFVLLIETTAGNTQGSHV